MVSSTPINDRIEAFYTWFHSSIGGYISPLLSIQQTETHGVHLITNSPIPLDLDGESPDLIACPEGLMITEPSSRDFILKAQNYIKTDEPKDRDQAQAENEGLGTALNERQWIASFLLIHMAALDEPGLLPSKQA
jgi:hypothetical protein